MSFLHDDHDDGFTTGMVAISLIFLTKSTKELRQRSRLHRPTHPQSTPFSSPHHGLCRPPVQVPYGETSPLTQLLTSRSFAASTSSGLNIDFLSAAPRKLINRCRPLGWLKVRNLGPQLPWIQEGGLVSQTGVSSRDIWISTYGPLVSCGLYT